MMGRVVPSGRVFLVSIGRWQEILTYWQKGGVYSTIVVPSIRRVLSPTADEDASALQGLRSGRYEARFGT